MIYKYILMRLPCIDMAINAGIYHLIGHTSTRRTGVTSRLANPVSIFRNPHQMITMVKNRVAAFAVLRLWWSNIRTGWHSNVRKD